VIDVGDRSWFDLGSSQVRMSERIEGEEKEKERKKER
jgi:hypothetical protein